MKAIYTGGAKNAEKAYDKVHKQKYAITCNSGTATLHSILNSFGVGHGDEPVNGDTAIVPSFAAAARR